MEFVARKPDDNPSELTVAEGDRPLPLGRSAQSRQYQPAKASMLVMTSVRSQTIFATRDNCYDCFAPNLCNLHIRLDYFDESF
jgi:hypothetical protein